MWGSPTGSLPGEVGATDEGFDDPQANVRRPLVAIQLQTFIQYDFYRIRKIYAVMLLRLTCAK